MGLLIQAIGGICGLVGLVCFILVIVQMFKRDETKLAIICLVLFLCCGIGYLIAFVYGWIKVKEWDLKNIMIAWTAAFVLGFIVNIIGFAMGVGAAAAGGGQFNAEMMDPGSMSLDIDLEGADFGTTTFPDPTE